MDQATQVKILGATADGFRVGGYGVVWGGQDVVGDFFTKDTDFWFDRLTERPMVLYQHGGDGMLKRAVVGQVVAKRVDDVGLWIEAQITTAKKYAEAIRALVEKGMLGWSSGAVGYLVDRVKAGDRAWVKSWPIAEFSLTPTPAEPRTVGVRMVKALAGLDAGLAGLLDADDLEDGRAGAHQEDSMSGTIVALDTLPDSAFAHVEPGELDTERKTVPRGKRHFPHHDAAGAVDRDRLREAIAAARVSPHAAKALPHLLRHAAGAEDADDPVWLDGVAPALLVVAHDLLGLVDRVVAQQKALASLGEETKTGWLVRATLRQDLRETGARLDALLDRAEGADVGADVSTLSEFWNMQRELLEV